MFGQQFHKIASKAKVKPVHNRVLLRAEHKPGNIITVSPHQIIENLIPYPSNIISLSEK